MEKKLKRRFVSFNVLVISSVMVVMLAFSKFHAGQNIPIIRMVGLLVLLTLITAVASVIISKMALAPIRRAWQQQLDFTANASHELRTPLAALRLNLEIALAELEDIPEDKKKWLENSVAEADRMSELVEDLLTLSRADTGKQQLINEKVCVDRIIRKTIEPLRPQAGLAGLSIEMSLEQDVSLLCDEKRISQLVTILVDNAIKYSGREGVIHVELKKKEKQVQLEISDSGVGIAPEQLAQIFDRFYRADPARSAQNPGSGLGLSIAKWIAESHGGSILAESTVGKGTKFTVLIPNG